MNTRNSVAMSSADVLASYGMRNAGDLVTAADTENVPLFIAAAVAEKESGGANVYGHDAGGTNQGAGAVTAANYAAFYDHVVNHGGRSNGVGPMQITYPGYFPDAAARGFRLWVPLDNFRYGLRIIRAYLAGSSSAAAINRAGQRYNSGSSTGAPAYGSSLVTLAHRWATRLGASYGVPTLRPGSTGAAVRRLQSGLNRVFPAYSHLTVNSVFGPATKAVVREFQARSGLQDDGVVGSRTRTALALYGIRP